MGTAGLVISIAIGLLTICAFLVSYGVWKGRMETKLEGLEEKFKRHDSEHRQLGGQVSDAREELAETRGKLRASFTNERD
jgi:FtsZ-interacting cell division protein ZipA